MQMPFGIRQQIDRMRAFAAYAEAKAHDDTTRAFAANLHEAAANLETMARVVFGPLDPDFPPIPAARTSLALPPGSP